MLKNFFRNFWMRKFEKKYAFYKYDDGQVLYMIEADDPDAKISFRDGVKMMLDNDFAFHSLTGSMKEDMYILKKLRKNPNWTN